MSSKEKITSDAEIAVLSDSLKRTEKIAALQKNMTNLEMWIKVVNIGMFPGEYCEHVESLRSQLASMIVQTQTALNGVKSGRA